jgi:hypothetical protein
MSGLCFEAQTPAGAFRLCVEPLPGDAARRSAGAPAGLPDAVEAALALSRCEPLVAHCEAWFGAELDLAPVEPGRPAAPGLAASVHDPALAPAGTRLACAWGLLRLAPPPAPLQAPRLRWADLLLQAELARFATPPVDAGELREDAMLLLPASFEAPWAAALVDDAARLRLPVHWRLDGNPRVQLQRPLGHAPADGDPAWRVLARDAIRVEPAVALGWQPGPCEVGGAVPDGAPGWPTPTAAQLLVHGLPVAEGLVVAALQGAALWIRRCLPLPAVHPGAA